VIRYGASSETDAREILRMVRQNVCQASSGEASGLGMRGELHETAILLNFLLDVETACDGATDRTGWTKTRAETHERTMRVMRQYCGDGRPPYQRESEGQSTGKPPSSLHELSLVLARHAEAHRQATIQTHAALNRVGLLRGAGNAIVPQVAAEVIRAYMDI